VILQQLVGAAVNNCLDEKLRDSVKSASSPQIKLAMMNSDSIDVSTDATEPIMRFLQTNMDSNKGRIVLTVLYLCVLSFCVIVPVYFYCRMQCEERSNSQVRELEVATISQAMAESQNVHREESRAQRQKYREERRARIIQLFMPVRMVRLSFSGNPPTATESSKAHIFLCFSDPKRRSFCGIETKSTATE
jgi:hypothetical protein